MSSTCRLTSVGYPAARDGSHDHPAQGQNSKDKEKVCAYTGGHFEAQEIKGEQPGNLGDERRQLVGILKLLFQFETGVSPS